MFKVGDILISKERLKVGWQDETKKFVFLELINERFGTKGVRYNIKIHHEGREGWKESKNHIFLMDVENKYRLATETDLLLYF